MERQHKMADTSYTVHIDTWIAQQVGDSRPLIGEKNLSSSQSIDNNKMAAKNAYPQIFR